MRKSSQNFIFLEGSQSMKLVPMHWKGFPILEVWNFDLSQNPLPDESKRYFALRFRESRTNVEGRLKPFRNGVIQLPVDDCRLDKKFAYEVRRAEKEGAQVSCSDVSENSIQDWFDDFVKFHLSKNLHMIPLSTLRKYAGAGALQLSTGLLADQPVVHHLYFSDSVEPLLLASFPTQHFLNSGLDRKYFGWINRYLHSQDMKKFSEMGCSSYSLGGMGNPVTKFNQGIVAFKEEMKPTIREDFNGMICQRFPLTILSALRNLMF